jgi:glutaminase
MYDYSGQFAFHVGLPAKSGVSGVMIVVVPNLMGIALWSPALDKLGNSCRGVEFCKELINNFSFHNYDSLVHNEESQKYDPRRRLGDRRKDQVVSLLFAAKAGDLNTIRRMYMQGCDLEMADYDKRTALHLAASEGHPEVILFLLNTAKVRPDPKDRWKRTPLQDARGEGHTSCIHLLEKAMCIMETPEHTDDNQSDGGIEQSTTTTSRPIFWNRTLSRASSIPSSSDESDDESSDSAYQTNSTYDRSVSVTSTNADSSVGG